MSAAVLEQVTELRSAARALPAGDVAATRAGRRALSAALGKLFAVAENYPDLKASANFLELQQQLSDLENELQMARRYYNGAVRNLNVLVQSFPSNLIAGPFGFAPRDYFECRMRASAPCRRSTGAAMTRLWRIAVLVGALLGAAPARSPPKSSNISIRASGRQGRRTHRHRNHARACRGPRDAARHLSRLSAHLQGRRRDAARGDLQHFSASPATARPEPYHTERSTASSASMPATRTR